MDLKIKFLFFICLFPVFSAYAQSEITNYLNIASPIIIDNKAYHLAWSAHPNQNHYKQEYLSNDQTLEKYSKILLIECVLGNFKLEHVIQQKTNELDKLKQQNPLVNYRVYENKDEYILDFLVSENSADGEKIKIVERNVYRYKLINQQGKVGVLLFAISERAYEDHLEIFFDNLKNNAAKLIETVGNFSIPIIEIK